jgi:hypothetical protein
VRYRDIDFKVFFVLKSLFNGERGTFATHAEGEGDGSLDDGWYYSIDDGSPPSGPYDSRDDAIDGAKEIVDNYDEDVEDSEIAFADPGGRSALRAATEDNPRNLPCPSCGRANRLTPADRALGYQCDACADRLESGWEE